MLASKYKIHLFLLVTLFLVLITITKHLGDTRIGNIFTIMLLMYQLYIPLAYSARLGFSNEDLGLSLEKWRVDLKHLFFWILLTFPLFIIGYHFYMSLFFQRTFISFSLPSNFIEFFLNQLIAVAITEELFYRGFLQKAFDRIWNPQPFHVIFPITISIVFSNIIFALAHFLGEYNILRLGPFFPGLVFGIMRYKTNSLISCTLFHLFCNLLGAILFESYHITE